MRIGSMEAILENIQKDISNLSNTVTGIHTRMDKLERTMANIQSKLGTAAYAGSDQAPFSHRLVERMDGVIGLREWVHSRRKIMQTIWAILFLLGCIGTLLIIYQATAEFLENPTATKVQVEENSSYHFPTMMICPDHWFDSNKIEQFGISKESLQYAFYYIQKDNMYNVPNVNKARTEFLDYYSAHNFTSLSEYFLQIAVDLKMYHNRADYDVSDSGVFGSPAEIQYIEKSFLWHGICFSYNLFPVDPSVDIHGKMPDTSNTDYSLLNWWMLYFDADFNFFQPIMPSLYLGPGDQASILVYVNKYVSMDQPNAPCLDDEQVGNNYSPNSCFAQCQDDLYQETINCRLLSLGFANDTRHPTTYCNYFEILNGTNVKLSDWYKLKASEDLNTKAVEICTNKCPRKCTRIIYETAIQWTKPLPDDADANAKNQSRFKISIRHNAMFDGGVWTLTEMTISTATDWVTKVGGCLGLFIGGSIMTLAQLIVFIMEYIVEKLGNRETKVTEIKM